MGVSYLSIKNMRAFNEGYAAYVFGQTATANPYTDQDGLDWLAGYDEAWLDDK